MKVLVTGGSSLLGRAVADQLVARGERVTSFQRSPSAGTADDALGDVRDRSAVLAAADGHDAIIHLAALVARLVLAAPPGDAPRPRTKAFRLASYLRFLRKMCSHNLRASHFFRKALVVPALGISSRNFWINP